MQFDFTNPAQHRLSAAVATAGLLIIALVVRFADPRPMMQSGATCKVFVDNARRLLSVSDQDTCAALKLKHAAMAAANLEMARQLYSDNVIEKATGCDVHAFMQILQQRTNTATERVIQARDASTAPRGTKRPTTRLPLWN